MASEFDNTGFISWAVGNGDSTTIIVVPNETVVQVDLRHLTLAEDEEDPHVAIIDKLEDNLPKVSGKPHLSVFVLTHPDKDHIQGFEELLERIEIGEIWFTPRIFREYSKDLCDDAIAFKKEVERRRDITIEAGYEPASGNKIRIIGYDELLADEEYEGFPDACRTVPGNSIYRLDGTDFKDSFEAFIHAPFKDDSAGERNDTSLAIQLTLKKDEKTSKMLIFGDLKYPTIRRVFDETKKADNLDKLEWNILLGAHHCSKSVMYYQDEADEEATLKQDILDDIKASAQDDAYIVVSCESDFSDEQGKNPPHLKARNRYEELVDAGHFLCTHEHPNQEMPEPIQFTLDDEGHHYIEGGDNFESNDSNDLVQAINYVRGDDSPPEEPVGFG